MPAPKLRRNNAWSNGSHPLRIHVELDPNGGLLGFEALKQLIVNYRGAFDIEQCVFAQEGLTKVPKPMRTWLRRYKTTPR